MNDPQCYNICTLPMLYILQSTYCNYHDIMTPLGIRSYKQFVVSCYFNKRATFKHHRKYAYRHCMDVDMHTGNMTYKNTAGAQMQMFLYPEIYLCLHVKS